ncbi:MAG: hypothetical protein ACRC4N_16300, partial [Gammaproteobacteria bacterium]
ESPNRRLQREVQRTEGVEPIKRSGWEEVWAKGRTQERMSPKREERLAWRTNKASREKEAKSQRTAITPAQPERD